MKTITLTLEDIPDKVFIPVVRKRDILKAQILPMRDKKKLPKGSSDVQVETPLGHARLLSRNEIMTSYFYLSGHKISLSGWKSGKNYTLTRNDNTSAFAMMIPLNCVVYLNGTINKAKNENGQYLVCLADANGAIDRSTASIISRPMFRKMFNVLPNEVIDRHKGSCNKLFNRNSPKPVVTETQRLNGQTHGVVESSKESSKESRKLPSNNNTTEQRTGTAITTGKSAGNKFIAVGKLLNEDNKIVGFVIQDSKGMTKQISKREMLNLCSKKLVDNIILATKEPDGSKYLRGNGIKIESLTTLHI